MTLLGFLKSLATAEEPCTTRVVEVRGAKMELKRCERPVKVTYRLYRDHGGYPEGEMDLLKPSKEQTVVVDYVSVNTKSQKKGVGTFLYEEAAKEACRLRYTLTSSNYRSEFSEAFWRKQARKGRAGCVAVREVSSRYLWRRHNGPR